MPKDTADHDTVLAGSRVPFVRPSEPRQTPPWAGRDTRGAPHPYFDQGGIDVALEPRQHNKEPF